MRFREKVQIFIFGLSVGLLVACLFFIFKLDSYFRKIDFSLSSRDKTAVSEEIVKKEIKTGEERAKKTMRTGGTKNTDSIPVYKTTQVVSVNDLRDTAYNQGETYKVLTEELISVKNVYVRVYGPKEKVSQSDSLVASLAGIQVPDEKEFCMIEFWKAPLNSRGYKMTRNRLLIYGFQENSDLALVKLNDDYFLRNNKIVYKLTYSPEFKPLERAIETEFAGKF